MSRKSNLGTAVVVILSLAVGIASCGDMPRKFDPQKIAARFQAADRNHDGKLTLAEAKAGMPRVAAVFSQIDVANRGYVTLAQIQAFAASH